MKALTMTGEVNHGFSLGYESHGLIVTMLGDIYHHMNACKPHCSEMCEYHSSNTDMVHIRNDCNM